VIPASVFIISLIVLFWVRKIALNHLDRWLNKNKWLEDSLLVQSIKLPTSLLSLIFSLHLGLAVSRIDINWKTPIENVLWSLVVVAFALALLSISRGFVRIYGHKLNLTKHFLILSRNTIQIVILIIALLMIMDIWGMPTSPLLLLIAVIILIALLAFRDSVPNLFASFQIAAMQQIKPGDYIKLDSKEEGYITSIGWNNARILGLDGSVILVPNSQLIRRKVINYGHPLKKAVEPFQFNTRVHLTETTGLRASNLKEFAAILKIMPDSVIYYHTHHFLEENQYAISELSNEFAYWVKDALGNDALAEKLARISIFDFDSSKAFRDKLVSIIEENLEQNDSQPDVEGGREFFFMKSTGLILPTTYVAHDLREFVESLRRINFQTLYFHTFESRLRLGRETNDFSIWLGKCMDEIELSEEMAHISPYTYTLEELRSLIIQVIEKRIK